MAATLGESKPLCLKWNPLMLRTFAPTQIHLGSIFKNKTNSFIIKNSSKLVRRSSSSSSSSTSSNFNSVVEGFVNSKCIHKDNQLEEEEEEEVKERKGINSFEGIVEAILKALKALQKPALAVVLLGVLLTYNNRNLHSTALAASGGRVGGWASSSSSSRSSSSRSSYGSYSSGSIRYSSGSRDSEASSKPIELDPFWTTMLVVLFIVLPLCLVLYTLTRKKTVLKLQVGLLGTARSLQRDLDKIAEAEDTSTAKGLNSVLKETTLALLRYPDYWISGYSHVHVKEVKDGEECLIEHFNQLSIEERGKFDEETLVNANNIKRTTTSRTTDNGLSNEYIVITILVAADGLLELPAISSIADLKDALVKLGSITASNTMAVEVLWTPQKENDTLTEHEFLKDYPLLKPLQG